jgi:hypothetical protein
MNILPLFSGLENTKQEKVLLGDILRTSCCLNMKIEAIRSSEMSDSYRISRSYNAEDGTFRLALFKKKVTKNGVFWDVTPYFSLRTDIWEELSASLLRVTRIGELGTMLAVTSNRRTLRRNTKSCHPDEGGFKFLRNVGS